MWTIHVIRNTVRVPAKAAPELFKAQGQGYEEAWSDEDEVLYKGKLTFNPDHFEHMDYLSHSEAILEVLCRHRVKGDICFADLEQGDEGGSFWGYRFDGKGGLVKLEGRVVFEERPEPLKGLVLCFSGKLDGLTRQAATELAEANGARVVRTVTGKTTHLVAGAKAGGKLDKAIFTKGVATISEAQFLKMIGWK